MWTWAALNEDGATAAGTRLGIISGRHNQKQFKKERKKGSWKPSFLLAWARLSGLNHLGTGEAHPFLFNTSVINSCVAASGLVPRRCRQLVVAKNFCLSIPEVLKNYFSIEKRIMSRRDSRSRFFESWQIDCLKWARDGASPSRGRLASTAQVQPVRHSANTAWHAIQRLIHIYSRRRLACARVGISSESILQIILSERLHVSKKQTNKTTNIFFLA